MSKISIIVPIYNVKEEFFKVCMKSLLNQTIKNIEIILVNDGSTNNIGELCNQYSQLDERIKVVHQKNQGVSVARNTGIQVANGEWITFVDPDDWIELNMCEELLKIISNNDLDILIFSYFDTFENRIDEKLWGNDEIITLNRREHELLQRGILDYNGEFLPVYFGAVWGNLYKKSFVDEYKLRFIPGLTKAQDTVFNLYALEYAKHVKYLNKALYYYRHNTESVCYRYNPTIDKALIKLLKEINLFLNYFEKSNNKLFMEAYNKKVLTTLMENLKLNYFHRENLEIQKVNKKNFLNLISQEPYCDMIKSNNMNLNIKKKILLLCIEKKNYYLLKFLFKINELKEAKIKKAYMTDNT